jgi:hypothetical protein
MLQNIFFATIIFHSLIQKQTTLIRNMNVVMNSDQFTFNSLSQKKKNPHNNFGLVPFEGTRRTESGSNVFITPPFPI